MRCNSCHQPSTATQCQASSLVYTMTEEGRGGRGGRFRQWVAEKNQMVTLVVLLGLGGVFWSTTEAFAPQIAQADTARVELSLDRQPNETYETLVGRAEEAAIAAAQASFDQDNQVTDVNIIIAGQNQGSIAPVLSLKVSRPQWLSRPEAQHWATYFTNAQFLLRFKDIATTTPEQTETETPAPTPEQPTNTTPEQTETETPAPTPEQPTNTTPGQTGTETPAAAPEQPTNTTPGQTGTETPAAAPGQPTNTTPGQTGTETPAAPSQTLDPGTGLVPQPPVSAPVTPTGDSQSPTSPDSVSPSVPSTSTPAINNSDPASVPNGSGGSSNLGDNE